MSTQAINRANSRPEPKNGDSPGKKKFGLVLQGAAALGAYEAGAIEYLYESGMECAIVSGASSGAMNAATLAGAKGYPPQVLRELWGMLAVKPPIPFLPPVIRQSWSMFGVPHMYTPRLDWWNMQSWTYASDNTPYRKTLEDLLDWDQIRDPEHMRLFVSASDIAALILEPIQGEGGDNHFRPEFFNRIDDVIVFHRLTREEIEDIVEIQGDHRDRCRERAGHLNRYIESLAQCETCSRHVLAKRLTFHILGGHEVQRANLSDLVNSKDIRMIKGRCGFGFPLEPADRLCVTGKFSRKKL